MGVRAYRIYSSDLTGFARSTATHIGTTTEARFSYVARTDEIEQLRYYRVAAVTDYGEVPYAEFTATIYAVDYAATDGTAGENNADGNMIYDSDYKGTEFQDGTTKTGDGWLTNTPALIYTNVPGASNTTPGPNGDTAFLNPTNAYDASLATSSVGTSTWTSAGSVEHRAVLRIGFAAATRTGRGKLRGNISGVGQGTVELWYSTNGGSSFTKFASPTSASPLDYYTPRVVGQVMANFLIEARPLANTLGPSTSRAFAVVEVSFDAEPASQVIAHMVDDRLELTGVSGVSSGEGRRAFPGKSPPANGVYLVTGDPNRWELKVQRLVAGTAGTRNLYLRLNDTLSGRVWTVATILPADIVDTWRTFQGMFDPGVNPVAGYVEVAVITDDPSGYRVDQVYIGRQQVMTGYQVSAEDQAQGRFPDVRLGRATNWPKGKLVVGAAGYRYVAVTG